MKFEGVGHVHFVCPADHIWPELTQSSFVELDAETLQARCVDGLDCWVTRTYYELRCVGYSVSIGPELDFESVNIVGIRHFGRRQHDVNSFVVAPRLDGHHPARANFVIYQNDLMSKGPDNGHVYHWVQPNISKREDSLGRGLKNIVYKGALINLDEQFRSDAFRSALAKMEVSLTLDAIEGDAGSHTWGDYRRADAVLAVRNLTQYDALYKPASKLINAWWADVPALLGPEPAFQELRRNELDYLEISSADQALEAIARLKAEPALYEAMVNNGRLRRNDFSTENTVQAWVDLLEGKIAQSFERWQRKSSVHKMCRYGAGLWQEPINKRKHHRRALSGARILQNESL